jgi:SPP1 family predicted phage head-tail adaptor
MASKGAGRFRHRVDIVDPNESEDSVGQMVESATTVHSAIPANVYDTGGNERVRGQQVEPHITTIVEIRYVSGITPNYYVTEGSRRLNIDHIQDMQGRQRYLMLHCVEVAGGS